jgi:4-hydroxybenzoate polyprenyltransferase
VRKLVAILRFVRFPLVWTALADSLAAAAVAAAPAGHLDPAALWPLVLISPAVYLFGMALNDLVDQADDRRAGRDRPLAAGELTRGAARLTLVFLLGLLLIGASAAPEPALEMIAATLVAVVLYNGVAKRRTATAAPLMAACRAGNLLIGWAMVAGTWRFWTAANAPVAWALIGSVAALTAAASLVSGLEKRGSLRRVGPLSPSAAVLALLLMLPVADAACVAAAWGATPWAMLFLAAIPLVVVTSAALRRLRRRAP